MPKQVPGKLAGSTPIVGRKKPGRKRRSAAWKQKQGRSILSNHEGLLPDVVDGRSRMARRFRDLVGAFVADMGGLDQCSEIKRNLLRRLAATTVQAELLESRLVNGEPINVAELCALASTSLRLSSRLGIERVPKPVETLSEYLARTYGDQSEGEADEGEGEEADETEEEAE